MKGYPTGSRSSRCRATCRDPACRATAALAGAPAPAQPLDAAQLGRVLFLGAGVVRTERSGTGATSCSARPVRPGALPARGLREHARRGRRPGRRALVRPASSTRWSRSAPAAGGEATTTRRHRRAVADGLALRRARMATHYWDAGTLLSQLSAAAASAGLRAPAALALPRRRGARRWSARTACTSTRVALLSLGDGRAGDRSRPAPAAPGEPAARRAPAVHRGAAGRRAGRARRAVAGRAGAARRAAVAVRSTTWCGGAARSG